MIVETYINRAKCNGCGAYLWTNPGSTRVACLCTVGEIASESLYGCSAVTDEVEFKQAVADYYGVSVNEVTVEAG